MESSLTLANSHFTEDGPNEFLAIFLCFSRPSPTYNGSVRLVYRLETAFLGQNRGCFTYAESLLGETV